MYDPKESDTGQTDWIELYNKSNESVFLSEYSFGINDDYNLEINDTGEYYLHCHQLDQTVTIPPQKYAILVNNDTFFHNKYGFHPEISAYDTTLGLASKEDFIRLSYNKCKTFFAEVKYEKSFGGSNNGKTIEKKELNNTYTESAWQESCIEGGTPGKETSDCEDDDEEDDENKDEDEEPDYTGKVKINEILPSPQTGEKEFIEFLNLSGEKIDISGWYILDEKNNKKILAEEKTEIEKYFHKYDSFSLNSDGDTIFLYDKNGEIIDQQNYDKAKSKYSYAFDGSVWRWTSKLTPGEENQFDPILSGHIKKDKNIYANVYANFEADDVHESAKKFTWNFGDGHKSYLKITRHKYEKTGKYQASLKIIGDGEDAVYDFEVEVKKYPQPKVRIKSVSPNPKGNDTESEYITLENKTKKKINLKNWSIATGWESLVNHPIREDFEIKAGKTKKLTRDICAFTLANVKTKIELRSPDGKIVQSLKYDKKKEKLEEGELYEKTEDGWGWIKTQSDTEKETSNDTKDKQSNTNNSAETEINIAPEELQAAIGKYTPFGDWEGKIKSRNNLVGYGTTIKLAGVVSAGQPRVLGASVVKQYENHYAFTAHVSQKHWATALFDSFWTKINSGMNRIMNKL